jgi:drug/metabolite transporter (DMT)-like permease
MVCSMTLVYWGAQYVSSGLLSVIGGTGPIITGLLATVILKDRVFTFMRVIGMLLGVLGLVLIFHSSILTQTNQAKGIVAILLSGTFQSLSAVMIKYWRAPIAPVVPCYTLIWILMGTPIQPVVDAQSIGAIVYLALFGSVIGFVTYFFLIQKISAHNVAMVSLITPAFAMAIGHMVNNELWQPTELMGAAFIFFGLSIFQLNKA